MVEGQDDPPAFVWDVLKSQGAQLVKDARELETSEENLAELREVFAGFTENRLPRLAVLGIIEMSGGLAARAEGA